MDILGFDLDDELESAFGTKKEEPAVIIPKDNLIDAYEVYRKANPGDFPNNYVTFEQFKALQEREQVVNGLSSMPEKTKAERRDNDVMSVSSMTDEQHREYIAIGGYNKELSAADKFLRGLTPPTIIPEAIYAPGKEPDYSSLPLGQKESQEMNGVKDHGLGMFTPLKEFDEQKPVLPDISEGIVMMPAGIASTPFEVTKENMHAIPFNPEQGREYYEFPEIVDTGQPDLFAIEEPVTVLDKKVTTVEPSTPLLKKALRQSEPKQTSLYENVMANITHESEPSNLPKAWVGIDPGKAGGIVAITERGIVGKWVIPLIGKDVDSQKLWLILNTIKEEYNPTLILEEVHSLHKMSASTNFSMGHTLGLILGIVIASKIRLIRVQPKAWQKEIWITSEIEYLPKTPEQNKPSINTKLTSIKAAHRLFPNVDFRKSDRATNPHDGICDSCCMAEYGRRKNL